MDIDVLEYQRDRALDWLRQRVQESDAPDSLDHELDSLIRDVAGLQNGCLYGFVRLPQAEVQTVSDSDLEPSQIRALRDTVIKLKPAASNYLKADEQLAATKDLVMTVAQLKQDRHQHHWIQLSNGHQGYIYSPHWEFSDVEKKKEIKLDVPYFYQDDIGQNIMGQEGGNVISPPMLWLQSIYSVEN